MLGHDVAATLPELRAQASSRMTSLATVRRRTGQTVQDETSGRDVPAWEVTHTDLPCRYKAGNQSQGTSRTIRLEGADVEQAVGQWHCPFDTEDLLDGDLVEITAGEWPGMVLRIVEASRGDQMTARRIPVVEVEKPTEWA